MECPQIARPPLYSPSQVQQRGGRPRRHVEQRGQPRGQGAVLQAVRGGRRRGRGLCHVQVRVCVCVCVCVCVLIADGVGSGGDHAHGGRVAAGVGVRVRVQAGGSVRPSSACCRHPPHSRSSPSPDHPHSYNRVNGTYACEEAAAHAEIRNVMGFQVRVLKRAPRVSVAV